MGILRLDRPLVAVLMVLAGCYSPAVRDCAVRCGASDECASGQICGSDGLCAAPERTGHCASGLLDGGPDRVPDASAMDAEGRDGSTLVKLHVQVNGKGSVVVVGWGTCSSLDPQRGDCLYDIPSEVAQTVTAVAIQPTEQFSKWTSMTCANDDESCTFTPVAATTIAARFEHTGVTL